MLALIEESTLSGDTMLDPTGSGTLSGDTMLAPTG